MDKDFVLDTGQKFVSNVLGTTGAIWGSSEVVCLRNEANRRLWRGIAGSMGIICFGLYLQERIIKHGQKKII
tara:strand:- start:4 stop:219 length:216 start_codon:yes stop_codon:yes gene_type:complete